MPSGAPSPRSSNRPRSPRSRPEGACPKDRPWDASRSGVAALLLVIVALVSVALALLLAVAAVAALVLAHRRERLVAVAVAILVLLVAGWAFAFAAAATDYHDADGFIDCWPHCSVLQDAVGGSLFFGPVLALLVVVATMLIAFGTRRR